MSENENIKHRVSTIVLSQNEHDEFIKYCNKMCSFAKLLRNATVFRCRQLLFAQRKGFKNLTEHEQQVLDEFKLTEDYYKPINEKYYLPSYKHFDYMYKITNNPDYNNGLGKHMAQYVIKQVLKEFKSFFESIKKYNAGGANYTGRPNLPGYTKGNEITVISSNQETEFKFKNNKVQLKLPKIKKYLDINEYNLGKLVHVKITPYYDTYRLSIVVEKEPKDLNLDKHRILGIDLGINNFVTTSNNCGLSPFIINGKELKSFNQYYNKKVSELNSLLRKGQYTSKRLTRLHKKRSNFFKDKMHKFSTYIINYCIKNNIGSVVVGKNKLWKNGINLGKVNNQKFVQIPYNEFLSLLKSKAELYNITIIEREESYTSKASFLDKDKIPKYDSKNKINHKFSGKRVERGLYQSKEGILINADVNGATNIIKKEFPYAFTGFYKFEYLYKTTLKVNL